MCKSEIGKGWLVFLDRTNFVRLFPLIEKKDAQETFRIFEFFRILNFLNIQIYSVDFNSFSNDFEFG